MWRRFRTVCLAGALTVLHFAAAPSAGEVNSLTLEIVESGTGGIGSIVEIELWMRNLNQPVTGYQAFLEFDEVTLQYRGDLSTYTSTPFSAHIQPIATAEINPGQINLDGFSFSGTGVDLDARLAVLRFDVSQPCVTTTVAFRDGPFNSELSAEGAAVPTALADTPPFFLSCDDGVFCNGAETCNASDQCQSGGDPCMANEWCSETDDTCYEFGDGDFNQDGVVDLSDFGPFQRCFGQSGTSGACATGNMAGGHTINLEDYMLFAEALTGPP